VANNKEFYRLDLVIGTDGVEETEKQVKAMDKLLEQTQRRAAALGKTKITPSARLQDKVTSSAQKVTSTMNKVDRIRSKPEAKLIDKVSSVASKITSTLSGLARKPFSIIIRAKDLATATIRKVMNVLTSPLAMLGVGGGVAGVTTVGLNMVMEEQSITSAFKVMLGSAEKAAKRVQELTTFAGSTPYKREEIYEASRVLQVFTGNALSTGEGLKMVGDIAAGTKQEFGDVALWVGRLYDAMKSGRAVGEMTSRLQEMGAIGGDARSGIEALAKSGMKIEKTWPLVTQGFSKFDGMMEDMSGNLQNLLLGTKSFFTQNVIKRWGRGVESALSPVLKKFRQWRGENKETIVSIGEWFEAAGNKATTFVMEKGKRAFKVLSDMSNDPAFQDADLFGKAKIAWDTIITQPLSEWWSSGGEQKIAETSAKIGTALGGGMKGFILGALGLFDKSDTGDESVYVSAGKTAGEAFFASFVEAFDIGAIANKLGETLWNVHKDVVEDPSAGNIAKAGILDWALWGLGGGALLKGGAKLGKGIFNVFGGGTKTAAVATQMAAGSATGAATVAGATTATGELSRIATYGTRGSGLARMLSSISKVLGIAGLGFSVYETQKYMEETGVSDAVSNAPKNIWNSLNTPTTEINGKSTKGMGFIEANKELGKGTWNSVTSKDQWSKFGEGILRTWDTVRGEDPEKRYKTSMSNGFLNSPFNKYSEVFKPVEFKNPASAYQDVMKGSGKSTGISTEQVIQIPPDKVSAVVSNPEFKQEVTNSINITIPAGAVQVNFPKDTIDYSEVADKVGWQVADLLRRNMQNIK